MSRLLDHGDLVVATGGPRAGQRGTVEGQHDDEHFLVKWESGEETIPWAGFLKRIPRIGEEAACGDCGACGVVVCTVNAGHEDDFDPKLAASVKVALEPSAHGAGLTCRSCETQRLKTALPRRGICVHCGKTNAAAVSKDLGPTRSFCDEGCVNAYVNVRLASGEARLSEEVQEEGNG